MKKKTGYIVIIGCGKFGLFLAKYLQEAGIDVQIIEKKESVVQEIKGLADQVKSGDAKNKKALEEMQIQNADEVIVSLRSNVLDSLLIVSNLKEIGVKKIRAMAVSEDHEKLLRAIGATDILNPDEYLARDMADKIKNPNLLDNLASLDGRILVKQAPPVDFVGKSLGELELNKKYDIIVTDIYLPDGNRIIPTGDYVITQDDVMVMLGPKEKLENLLKQQCRELPPDNGAEKTS